MTAPTEVGSTGHSYSLTFRLGSLGIYYQDDTTKGDRGIQDASDQKAGP